MGSNLDELRRILGPSPWSEGRSFAAVEREWDITVPSDVKDVGLLYGDCMVSDFLFIFGPASMVPKGDWMSSYVREGKSCKIPRPVIPDADGMLHWGHSIDGDRLFLEDRGSGFWTVSAFRRDWGDWYESDLALADWLVEIFEGRLATDWMPEWPATHSLETLD
ncbi:hypothetical protein SSP24_25970 [Streptomyces spinoverrucosus]|uniref:Knr4/Smi1-like domain-containing protein n=2 Tax=Streptomyces spinoverrucosus TaxID=284043 RepID=A0A4Y3VCP3_9ACTN|nr:hypothetical protein SSP24_25970 [Streptomyces spinoverrucosus]GHB60841.1 hypothetical protein GCM10010397_33810 [Streptomyces spinoverrucosus]